MIVGRDDDVLGLESWEERLYWYMVMYLVYSGKYDDKSVQDVFDTLRGIFPEHVAESVRSRYGDKKD